MAYLVEKLISGAYYASGIVSREFETVSGQQFQDGLDMLNDILGDKAIEKDMLPYYTNFTFNAVSNQERYFIAGLEAIDTLVFYKNSIRYFMKSVPRISYFGDSRANNISSLPFNWHLERQPGGANLYLYFFPDIAYPMEIWGLFRLQEVSLNQDLMALNTIANLGTPTVTGAGTITTGNLVVNGIDLAGTYATAQALVNYINTGVITNVTAGITGTQLILTGPKNSVINVTSTGTESISNNITFAYFSTLNGSNNQNFMSTSYDRFYINYLKFCLASRLCKEFNYSIPQGVTQQLLQYELWISNRSAPLDLSMKKVSTLSSDRSLNYGDVNLGLGWGIG